MSALNFSELKIDDMNNLRDNGQQENNAEENVQQDEDDESLYVPNWIVEVMESITREEMIKRGICTASRLFQQLCYPKLHGNVEPHRIEYLHISHDIDYHNQTEIPRALMRKRKAAPGQPRFLVHVPIPEVAPPPYIIGYKRIDICFLDEQILHFMRIIDPVLQNCIIKCKMFMENWKPFETRTLQLYQLLKPMMDAGKITTLCFARNRFAFFQRIFPEIVDQMQSLSIKESNMNFELLLNWLMRRRRNDGGGQKILSLRGKGLETPILERIKKEFSISTYPANFLIWQEKFELDKFIMENQIGEILELYENSKGQCFLARFPKGEDHWKEVGEKKIWPSDDEEPQTNINLNIEIKSDASYVDSVWEILKEGIQKFFLKEEDWKYRYGNRFEQLYTSGYVMVLNQRGQILYDGIKAIVREHLQTNIRIMLTDLIDNDDNDDHFIASFNNAWEKFTSTMKVVRDICQYMERTHILKAGLMPLYELGLHLFGEEVVQYPLIKLHLKAIFGEDFNEAKGKIEDSLIDFLLKHR